MLKVFPIPEALSELSSVTFDITFRMLSPLPLNLASRGLPTVFTMIPSLSAATPEGSFRQRLKAHSMDQGIHWV